MLLADTSAVSHKLIDLVGRGGESSADIGAASVNNLTDTLSILTAMDSAGHVASAARMIHTWYQHHTEQYITKLTKPNSTPFTPQTTNT